MLSRSVQLLSKPRNLVLASTSALALTYVATSSSSRPFHLSTASMSNKHNFPLKLSEGEWRAKLSPEQFRVLREQGTERAGTGEYDQHFAGKGVYECAGCGTPLYTADMKFKSGCGWPAFFDAIPGAIKENVDRSWGMERVEIVCANCGGHQGHVFKGEGYDTPTDARHCVNSISLRFNPKSELKYQGPGKNKA
ncbi:putative methionine-R-sulfoxide reductase SelR [Rhodotorula diobovata]|uniref:Peptide-methionine (R)-S-oxide reductase n=1 Tax=Rhodotorula diobovata TaxID=5288 RepID=A0A5C5FZ13_9BASI|nr:putative methionine-R-sulfoxide reductase SelR [Rhodotorula diobovata]